MFYSDDSGPQRLWFIIGVLTIASVGGAEEVALWTLTVPPAAHVRPHTPVYADVDLPSAPAETLQVRLQPDDGGETVPGQIERLDGRRVRLWWILDEVPAGQARRYRATVTTGPDTAEVPVFSWRDNPGQYLDLFYGDRPVLRTLYAYDPNQLQETYKVYHHLFTPDGTRFLTKGSGGLYPHHRGLFIGWNKLGFAVKTADWWHMKPDGTTQRHQKFLELTAGPVFARSRYLIHWNDVQSQPVVTEEREVTLFRQPPDVILLDFVSHLRAARGEVRLDGDKEHAGFHFRADNEVSVRQEETHYLFPPDRAQPVSTVNLPWVAMTFALGGSRYTAAHFNHPDNPVPTDYSADRKYGRFGAFFQRTLPPGEVLTVRYRVFVQEGEPSVEQIAARYRDFAEPPTVARE
jgi:hypothetical protein